MIFDYSRRLDPVFAAAVFAVSVGLGAHSVSADDTMPEALTNWFAALEAGDKQAVIDILADDAVIELKDLGISQTKTEFVDAFDQWTELNSGAKIAARVTNTLGDSVETEVCYTFPSNSVLNRETYTLNGDLVTGSVQEPIGEACGDL